MAVSRAKKVDLLAELKEKMSKSTSVVFANYIGMTVSEVSELRAKLRECNAEMKVGKKTLMRIAAKEQGWPEISDDKMAGPVACIFSFEDPLIGAQIAFKFAKDHNQVKLIGGVFEGKVLTAAEAVELAKMPNRQQLLGIFAGMLQSPLVSFASMCVNPLTGFARSLSEMAKKTTPSAS